VNGGYAVNDAVYYNGSSLWAIVANPGATTPDVDTTDWTLLAMQGGNWRNRCDRKAMGSVGPAGPTGVTGRRRTHKVSRATLEQRERPAQPVQRVRREQAELAQQLRAGWWPVDTP